LLSFVELAKLVDHSVFGSVLAERWPELALRGLPLDVRLCEFKSCITVSGRSEYDIGMFALAIALSTWISA